MNNLVVEPAILILSEQGHPDHRQSIGFQQLQPLFQRIVDVDQTPCTRD